MTTPPEASDYPAHLYAAVHDGTAGDVDFYRRRCAGAASILELGCGDARVLAGLAAEIRVGVDVDPGMLVLAQERDPSLELICADMRSLEPSQFGGRRFERVILPHGGLYCMLDADHLAEMLASVAQLLTAEGQLVLDVWAADEFHADAEPDDLVEGWLERVKVIELEGESWEVLERSSWDKATQRIDATYLHVRVGSETAIEAVLRQRYVLAEQLRGMLIAAGLELITVHGDFAGTAYGPEAELMVVSACRRPLT